MAYEDSDFLVVVPDVFFLVIAATDLRIEACVLAFSDFYFESVDDY